MPKALALRYTETAALLVAAPFRLLAHTFSWLVLFVAASTRLVLRLAGIRDAGPRTFVSEEEIKHMVSAGREQGVLDQTEMEIIHSVFQFKDTSVRKVMVPRPKVFALEADTAPGEVGSLIVESGFSRIPVYERSLDNVLGARLREGRAAAAREAPAGGAAQGAAPAAAGAGDEEGRRAAQGAEERRSHMAVVVDEHGSVSGHRHARRPDRGDRRRIQDESTGGAARRTGSRWFPWSWTGTLRRRPA